MGDPRRREPPEIVTTEIAPPMAVALAQARAVPLVA